MCKDGSYTFTNILAPADFVIAVYASSTSVDALDAELVASVPGAEVIVADFVIATPSATATVPPTQPTTPPTQPTTAPTTQPPNGSVP